MVLMPCGQCCCGPPLMPEEIEITLEQVWPVGDLYFFWRVTGDAGNPFNPGAAAAYFLPPIAGTYALTEMPPPPAFAAFLETEWYYASALDAWQAGRFTAAERIEAMFPDRAGRTFLPEFRITAGRRFAKVEIAERRAFMSPAYGEEFGEGQPPTKAQISGADWLATVQALPHFHGIGQIGGNFSNGGAVMLQESCPGEFNWSDANSRTRRHQRTGNSFLSDAPFWQGCALPFKINYTISDSVTVGAMPAAHNFPAGTLTTVGTAPFITLNVNLRVEYRVAAITYIYADGQESMFPARNDVVCDG